MLQKAPASDYLLQASEFIYKFIPNLADLLSLFICQVPTLHSFLQCYPFACYVRAPGDRLAVFSPDNAVCTGLATWTGSNIAITFWGDDTQTAVLDGTLSGGHMIFRFGDQSRATEYFAGVADFSLGNSIYLPDSMLHGEFLNAFFGLTK